MDIGKLGAWYFLDTMSAEASADTAGRLEELGYPVLWIPEALGREAFAASAFLLARTDKITIATGIANVYARDAMGAAAARKQLAEQSGGRFLLGLGVSHQPMVEGLRGHSYTKPLEFMSSYLDAMDRAPYIGPAPAEPAPIVIGALHPKMMKLAAERTRGIHPYLVPPEHTAFARETVGEGPLICTEQKVILETDPSKAREAARKAIGFYLELPNYRRNLMRFGMTESDFENGGSDKCVDAVVAWGDEKAIEARIRAHHDAGADHVCIQPLRADGQPEPDWRVFEAFAPASR